MTIENQGTGAGQIGFDGTNVTYGGTTIGTASGGSGTTALTITLNANANSAGVQKLAQAIQYNSVASTPGTGNRTITFDVSDGSESAPSVTRTVTIDQVLDTFSSTTPTQNVLNFDGGDHLSLGNSSAYIHGNAATWEAWINTSTTTGTQTIFGAGDLGSEQIFSSTFASTPSGISISGSATVTGGALRLTNSSSQVGTATINPSGSAEQTKYFTSTFDVKIGDNTTGTDGDGWSFNYGGTSFTGGNPEEGASAGLAITFDTFDNGSGDVFNQVQVLVDGAVRGTASAPGGTLLTETPRVLTLDGDNDYVDAGGGTGGELRLTGTMTAEAWVQPDTFDEPTKVVSIGGKSGDGDGAENFLFQITLTTGGDVELFHEYGTGTNQQVTFDTNLTAGQWVHLAAVRDATAKTYTLYVNGQQSGSPQSYTTNAAGGANASLLIGGEIESNDAIGNTLNGQVDDVRIWNTARTASEVAENYQKTLTGDFSGNLVSHFTFDGGNANDSAGSNNGTLTNGAATTTSHTAPARFEPVSITVDANGLDMSYKGTTLFTNLDLGSAYNPQSGHQFVMSSRTGGADDVVAIDNLTITSTDAGSVNALVVDGGELAFKTTDSTGTSTVSSDVSVADGNWHHVAMSHDGNNTLKLYVDGVHVKTQTGVTKEMIGGDAAIGQASDSNADHFTGQIGEVRVWDAVMTDAQIDNNFGPNLSNPSSTSNLVGYWNMKDVSGQTVTDLSSNSNTATLGASGSGGGDDPTTQSTTYPQLNSSHWTIVEGAGSYNGDTILVQDGNVEISNRELLRSSTEYDPTSSNPLYVTGRFTFEKAADIFSVITRSSGVADSSFFGYPTTAGSAQTMVGPALTAGQWYHAAVVIDSTADTGKLYLNGEAVATNTSLTLDPSQITTTVNYLGRSLHTADPDFDGQIGEFRIWNTARTDAQIADNYNNPLTGSESGLVTYYTFDELVSGAVVDEAGANNATVTGATIVDIAPTVYGTEVTIQENEAVTGTMATNDVAGTPTYSVQTAATKGTVIVDSTSGEWTYVPDVNYRGTDTFTLRATGATRGTDDETITVTVNAVNNDSINVHDGMVQFDGSNDLMRATVGTNTFSNQITMELWVNFLDLTAQQNPIRLGDAETTANRIVLEKRATTNNFSVFMGNNTTNTTVASDFVVSADTWYHTAFTYDGTTAKIYVNGNLVKSQAVSGVSLANTVQEVTVGGDTFGFFSKALVDDVRVWNTVRTAEQIRDNYDQQLTGSETNLQGYWRFDDDTAGTTLDDKTSNNRDGHLIEARYVMDMADPGGDGVATGMGVASVNNFPTEQITVEMWVIPDALNAALFSYAVSGSDNHLIFEVTSGGDLSVRRDATTVTITGVNIVVGAWTHLSVVWDAAADTVTVYQDGATAGSTTLVGGTMTTGGTIWLGNDQDSVGGGFQQNAAFDGRMSEVRLWDTARSATDIAADYNKQLVGTEEDLVGYWRLDESSGTTATDTTGNNNGTYQSNNTAQILRSPPIVAPDGPKLINNLGKALQFDGSDDVLEIIDTDTFDTANYTIETWVKLDSIANMTILGRTNSNGLGSQFSHLLHTDATGKFYHYTYDNVAASGKTALGSVTAVAGQWYHLAGTYDADTDTMKLYVDGQLQATTTGVGTPWPSGDRYQIGPNAAANNDFDGQMAEFRVWSSARTDAEIADSYNQALNPAAHSDLIGYYTFEGATGSAVTDLAGSVNGTVSGAKVVDTAPSVFGTALTVEENESVSGIMTGNDIVAPVLDLGRPGADGIATGMKFENFTDFPTTAISVELWVNPDQVPGDIVSYAVTGSDNEFLIGVNSSKTVVVYLNATAYTLTGLTVEPGQWDHLTVTWNGTDTLTGYKNGTQAATATTTVNDAMETGGTFYLGTDQDTVGGGFQNSNTYDGQVAEVRIWNDVRTSGEVSSNFNKELVGNEANLVAYWQLNEGSGTSAIDKTAGQSNAGTSNVTHTGTYESIGTAFVTAGEDVPALPLTNDGTVFSVTGAGTADADGRVTATTSNGGTVIVNQITGEYTYTPASNFYGTDTFTLTAAGDGDTSITDSETVSVTVNRVDHKSVNVHANVLKLDGSNDYVHASSVPTTKTDNITIETWFNWDGVTPTKNNVLVSLGTSTGNGVYVGGITSSGSLKLGANLPGAGTLLTDYTFTAGEWTHVALVRESGTWKFYVNGENQGISGGTASATSSITAPDANTWIGHTGFSSSEHFGGRIDEVRIWDDARTADEIRANYDQQMTGTEQNLQAYYRFEDNPGRTTVTDLTYNNHDGTLTNGAELSSTAGKSMTFDGSDDFIDLGTPGNLYTGTGAFTYEAWIKTTQSSNGYIVAVGDSSNNGASSLFFVTGGKVALHNPASQGPSSSTSVNDGQWHHVAATYSGGSVRLFVDGKLDATGTMATTLNLTSGAATIGKSVFGQFFNGEIADVRIWNDLRSDTEIREHYQKLLTGGEENLIAYYSFDDATASAVNDLAGSHNGTVTGAAVTESTAPIEGPTVRGTAIDTLDGDAVSGVMTADDLAGNPTYSVPSGPANGTVTIRANGEWTYTPTAGFVGTNTFTLRATDGTRTDDEVITVSVRSDDLGNVHDGVLQLDGSNDYVEMGRGASNELAITGNVTVEAWVNLADFQSQQNIIAQFAGPSENVADNILYGLRIDGSGDLVYFHEYAGAANEVLTFDANLTTATWAHVAVVRDVSGNTVTAYVNGNAVGNAQSYTNDPTSGGSSTLTIGEDNSSSTGIYTKGAIDDLRIWNTARTAEQIKHNYDQQQLGSESGLVAYYKFDDDHTGTTAADSAGTASNGTLSADSKVLSLDGTGDYLEVGNPSSIDFAAAITVEAWIKTSNTSGSQTIVGKSANGSWASGGKQLSLLANGKLVFNEFGGSLITGTTAINDGQWHHVAMTISEGGSSDVLKLYVDGVLETISAGTGAGTQSATIDRVADNGAHLVKVGSADGAGQFFNGQINDVRFWSDVRTQSEIYDSKNTVLVGNESGLARYFDFDRDTTAADDKASTNTANNGTLNGNASIISVNDSPTASEGPRILNTLGKAGDFDGSGDTITTSGIDLNNKSFSWEFWVNRDASDGTDLVLGARGSSDTSNSFFHAGWTTETNFRYSFEGSGSSNEINYTDTGGSIGQWAHWAGSFDATSKLMKLYKNGQLIATKTISQNLSTDNPLIIGGSQTSGHEINAKIDEVRIWYDVRTDQEILDNYNQTIAGDADNLAANYHFDAASGALVDSATGVGGTNSGTLNNDAARIETGPNVFGKAVTIEENETASGRFEADSTSYSVTGSPSNGAVVIDSATGAWIYTPTANFHGTDSFTVNASGAGTETVTVTVNSETTNSVNVADGALQFTGGTFDRMTADIGTGTLTNTLTLEMKVRFNDVSGQQNLAALFGESTDHGLIPYMSSGTFKTLVSDMADSSPTLTLDSGVTVAADTWYHLAVTYDGTTANYYVDGDLKATGSISGLTLASQAQKLVLGGNPLADPRYNQGVEVKGLIDEVRVWSDVRTAAEIRANKDQQLAGSEGNLEAYYRFDDDATGTTIEDITSNNRHGTTANGRYC